MKHMWKKNQIIITALAALVAVAGYLNYSGTKLGENALPASTTETEATLTDIDSLDQDITLTDSADGEVYLGEAAAGETDGMSDASLSASETDAGTDTASEEVTDTPGEAVLTSTGTGSSFAAQAKLTREQVRSKNKETLLEITPAPVVSSTSSVTSVSLLFICLSFLRLLRRFCPLCSLPSPTLCGWLYLSAASGFHLAVFQSVLPCHRLRQCS